MNATFRIGIVISLIFIAISVYMTIQGFVSWALTATFTVMLAVLLALMRYEKQPNRARQDSLVAQPALRQLAPATVAALSRASGCCQDALVASSPLHSFAAATVARQCRGARPFDLLRAVSTVEPLHRLRGREGARQPHLP
jgi:hypothetical protein